MQAKQEKWRIEVTKQMVKCTIFSKSRATYFYAQESIKLIAIQAAALELYYPYFACACPHYQFSQECILLHIAKYVRAHSFSCFACYKISHFHSNKLIPLIRFRIYASCLNSWNKGVTKSTYIDFLKFFFFFKKRTFSKCFLKPGSHTVIIIISPQIIMG